MSGTVDARFLRVIKQHTAPAAGRGTVFEEMRSGTSNTDSHQGAAAGWIGPERTSHARLLSSPKDLQ